MDTQTKQLIKAAFFIGYRAANHLHDLPKADLAEDTSDLLLSIKNGDFTLHDSAAELRAKHANAPLDIDDIVAENIKTERMIATVIIDLTRRA